MFYSAFFLGFIGSFHCLGMCGPIALALNGNQSMSFKVAIERILYNFGRATTYSLLGAIAGLLGQGMAYLIGYQLYLTAILGVVLVLIGIFAVNPDRLMNKVPMLGSWLGELRRLLGKYIAKGGLQTFFTIGLLNGLLPCGLVYMGLVGALASGHIFDGMLYMFLFGLGTLPMMLAVSLAGKLITVKFRNRVKRLYPVMFIALGLFLVFRAYSIDFDPAQNSGIVPEVTCH